MSDQIVVGMDPAADGHDFYAVYTSNVSIPRNAYWLPAEVIEELRKSPYWQDAPKPRPEPPTRRARRNDLWRRRR